MTADGPDVPPDSLDQLSMPELEGNPDFAITFRLILSDTWTRVTACLEVKQTSGNAQLLTIRSDGVVGLCATLWLCRTVCEPTA